MENLVLGGEKTTTTTTTTTIGFSPIGFADSLFAHLDALSVRSGFAFGASPKLATSDSILYSIGLTWPSCVQLRADYDNYAQAIQSDNH